MTTPPAPQTIIEPEISSDDRVWVLLCFLFTPIIPLITLFLEDKKDKPFIKFHTIPTLIFGIVEVIVVGVLAFIPIINCISPLIWIVNILYALKANKGEKVEIPVITNFAKQQGW
ncbi:MAG: hypothetical protein NTZ74_10460 [Chloroflexi bacterium]|nr:hypothetical protein [Chloroflexota bacterium]